MMMMRKLITCFLATIVMLMVSQHHPVASLNPNMQKIALFRFKQSLTISAHTICSYDTYFYSYVSRSHPKTLNWSMSSDYCTWEGVSCEHKTGDVIGLDLSCGQLQGAILPNSSLFQLSHLRSLNLFGNNFSLSSQFPQEFGFFAKGLTHLNLSSTGLSGRVPSGISHLYKLVSLDLSYNSGANLENEVFKSLLQNLTQLRVLNLALVSISSVLPVNYSTSIRVLNLEATDLHGVVPKEVLNLPNLEILDLSFNTLTATLVGDYISSTLRVLRLDFTGLPGVVPQEVFHLPNLEVLDLWRDIVSSDSNITATLPKFKWGSSATLRRLHLAHMNIDGGLPDSIGFLESLVDLNLYNCSLSGPIPRSVGHLGQLTSLGLDDNNLNGPIPTSLANLTSLRLLDLSGNNLSGPFPSFVAHTRKLVTLYLFNNAFTGSLPRWLFEHPSLETLHLDHNVFRGQLHEFDASKSQLKSFDCSYNQLSGPLPEAFSQLVSLTFVHFSSNNFSGVLDFKMFSRLQYLDTLDLSHNSLSVRNTSTFALPPTLSRLQLSACNLKEFPQFSRDAKISLISVDLSNHDIHGEIPLWMGSVKSYLNLSHNRLTGGIDQLPWNNIQFLDLQSNSLNGSLPTLICNSSSLEILNLSHNKMSGELPDCSQNLTSIKVFDLRMNKIQDNIPATLSNFRSLETINLNGNNLQGRVPSSFAGFEYLKVLDLGSNQIKDAFPQCLEALPNLQVLVLKSNKFHGIINKSSIIEHPFPSLRIIDLSDNELSGPLPSVYFKKFKAMMTADVNDIKATYMGPDLGTNAFYSDSTNLVIKGVEIELVRILTVFTTIDVSRNNFEGEVPGYIGNLVALRYLNLSHNHLTSHIPSSIGDLSMLESLDLSSNQLEGEIPQQLTDIYSLSRLNLSCNQLRGHIPEGSQFNTFENDSYIGNLGLCGHPLSKTCENDIGTYEEEDDVDDDYFFNGFTWEAVVIGYGCGVVPAFFIGYLMLLARKPKWFVGIIARELGLKIRRIEIKWR